MISYSGAIAQLLTAGECVHSLPSRWLNYAALGLTTADIPQLLQMSTDDELYNAMSDDPESWAPLHAWRALGQFQVAAAVAPLLQYSHDFTFEDGWLEWMFEELPLVFAMIGEASLPTLTTFLSDRTQPDNTRLLASHSLKKYAQGVGPNDTADPIIRQQCITLLTAELTHAADNTTDFNGFLLADLLDLNAVEAASVMEQAFAGNYVEESICGDWDEVQVVLGLKSRAEVPRKSYFWPDPGAEAPVIRPVPVGFRGAGRGYSKDQQKAKRKQQSESRRKNRKKKK